MEFFRKIYRSKLKKKKRVSVLMLKLDLVCFIFILSGFFMWENEVNCWMGKFVVEYL